MNPLGLGRFMSGRAAPDRDEARPSLRVCDVHAPDASVRVR
ncbi:hypothetical protein [Streptomyces aquilus]